MPRTIFHTTEKSNFILNMTKPRYQDFLYKIFFFFCLLMLLFCIPLEYISWYTVPMMAFAIVGVAAMVFVLIGLIKKIVPRQLAVVGVLCLAMVIWGYVSMLNSYKYSVALLGYDGRNDGFLSLLFYLCLFFLGCQFSNDRLRNRFLDVAIVFGLIQAVWGFLQSLPFDFTSSAYERLEPVLAYHVYLPSGFTGSPIFLAILLNLLMIPTAMALVMTDKRGKRIFYGITLVLFMIISVKTQCVVGFFAPILALVGLLIALAIKHSLKRCKLAVVLMLVGYFVGMGWVYVSPTLNGTTYGLSKSYAVENQIILYDGAIIWKDSAYRLSASGYPYSSVSEECTNGSFSPGDVSDSYFFLWKNTLRIIEKFPIVGTGEDNLAYPQLYVDYDITSNANVFDRAYDYYLQIAATMGIPQLLLFLALLFLVVNKGIRSIREKDWLHTSLVGGVILYLLVMVVSTPSITIAPLFWIFAGMCVAPKEEADS